MQKRGTILVLVSLLCAPFSGWAAPNQLSPKERTAGWKLLFDGKTTAGWRSFKKHSFPKGDWNVEDGWLHCLGHGGGDIISDGQFDQFALEWEWKQARGGNSGVKYFVTEKRRAALGHEYQMIDDWREPDAKAAHGKRVTAAFYDVFAPTTPPPLKQPGQVNHSRIVVIGNHVEHWLNGKKVLEYDCGSPATMAAVHASKFRHTPWFGTRIKGHILLQDHHSQVWFRNIKILDLSGNHADHWDWPVRSRSF